MQVRGEMTKHGVEEADETKKKVKLVRKEVRPSFQELQTPPSYKACSII